MRAIRLLAVVFAAISIRSVQADTVAQATGPTEIESGNLMVVKSPAGERWLIMPHSAAEHFVFVVTVGPTGDVAIAVHPLPTGGGTNQPPPQPANLTQLVRQWSQEANDPAGKVKLSAAYQATISLIDGGQVNTPETLVALQRAANTLVLGSSATKWVGFFTKLAAHLDANTPADLAGYRAAWIQISEGLK